MRDSRLRRKPVVRQMDQILEYNSDTLEFLKKQFDLDKPERLEEAIAILEEWLNKQQHLVRKSYCE